GRRTAAPLLHTESPRASDTSCYSQASGADFVGIACTPPGVKYLDYEHIRSDTPDRGAASPDHFRTGWQRASRAARAWHRGGFLRRLPRQQEGWHLHLPLLWSAAVQVQREIRFGYGLAELLPPV